MGSLGANVIACPCCHGQVSASVLDCPGCGHPIKPADALLLERLRTWALALLLVGGVAVALWRIFH